MSSAAADAVTDTPRVSVIVPTYDSGHFILAALQSVWEQAYPGVEVIVVDDGSTDDTAGVLRPYADRVRYVRQENAGSAVARNHGVALCRGEYVVFLDADDLLLPGKLAAQVPFLDARPELGAVHSGWRIVDTDGQTIKEMEPWHVAPRLDLETWVRWKPVKLGAMVFRRVWLERIGGFDPQFRQSQDVDLMLRLALAGCRMEWLRQSTLCYRHHAGSTISRGAAHQGHYVNLVLDKFFAQPNVPAAVRSRASTMRYYTRLWAAWHAYRHGAPDDTAAQLRAAAPLSSRDVTETALDWIVHFETWSARDARPRDDVAPLASLIATVLPDPSVPATLAWWCDVWRHYVGGARDAGRAGLARHRTTPLPRLLADVRRCLAVADDLPTSAVVEAWWRDLVAVHPDAAAAPHLLAGVLLELGLQHARQGEWPRIRVTLPAAIRASASWRAAPIWLAFLRQVATIAGSRFAAARLS